MFGFVSQDSDERKVVNIITERKNKGKDTADLSLFSNLLFDPVGRDGTDDYLGFYLGTNILRQEFNLKRIGKPGDFDIILIPYSVDKIFYERTAVYEVKIARPHIKDITKSTNSLGEKQIYGLIEDGFPLVGLIHVCMPEPLTLEHSTKIKTYKIPIKDYLQTDPPQLYSEDNFEDRDLDWLPWKAIDSQMKRIIRIGFPKYVAINAFSLMQRSDGKHNIGLLSAYDGFLSGYFNPRTTDEMIYSVEKHLLKYGDSRYKKLAW